MFIVQKILQDFRDGLHASLGICCIILFAIFVYEDKISVNLLNYTISTLLHDNNQSFMILRILQFTLFILIPF